LVTRAWAKHNQSNTPKRTTFSSVETITITDPCHPLFNRNFPLLHLTNHHNFEPCCLVQIIPGVERLIPVRQTNLSATTPFGFSSPLDLSSLQKLEETFAHILTQVEMECSDESEATKRGRNDGHSSPESLGDTGRHPTESGIASDCQSVSTDHRDLGAEGAG
jgi:hypothetical protein